MCRLCHENMGDYNRNVRQSSASKKNRWSDTRINRNGPVAKPRPNSAADSQIALSLGTSEHPVVQPLHLKAASQAAASNPIYSPTLSRRL